MEADEGESLSEKRDSEKLIKGGGTPGPGFGALGRLVIVGSLVDSFFWPIDGPPEKTINKYFVGRGGVAYFYLVRLKWF